MKINHVCAPAREYIMTRDNKKKKRNESVRKEKKRNESQKASSRRIDRLSYVAKNKSEEKNQNVHTINTITVYSTELQILLGRGFTGVITAPLPTR